MTVKMRILPDHMPINNVEMLIAGGPPGMTFTSIDGIEEEQDMVELPDRTKRPGGNTKPVEFKATMPMHHHVEMAYMEEWYAHALTGIPGFLRSIALKYPSQSGLNVKIITVANVWPCKKKYPNAEMNNEGEMAQVEWTLSGDLVIPSP